MTRRAVRAAWPLSLILLALAAHAGGCRKASSAARPEVTPASAHPWITPLMTPPPPLPTPTLWRRDITRVPALPE